MTATAQPGWCSGVLGGTSASRVDLCHPGVAAASRFKDRRGYANAIVAEGKLIFIGGQIGWDPKNAVPTFPASFADQFAAALSNVMTVLKTAGGSSEHLVRMTVYVTDKREYLASLKEIGAAWKKIVGPHYPAMALMQVVALVEDSARVEIEATAVLPVGSGKNER